MTKTKYIFLDIDGTLIPFGQKIPDSAKKALTLAAKKGHKLFIATGRSLFDIPKALTSLPFSGIVCAEGNHIEADQKVLLHHPIPDEDLKNALDFLIGENAAFFLQANHGTYTNPYSENRQRELRKKISGEEAPKGVNDFRKLEFPPYAIVDDLYLSDINKIWIVDCPLTPKEMEEKFYGRFRVVETDVSKMGGKNSCEMTPFGHTKAEGIKRVLDYYHADETDTFAFGDDLNDREMIALAGVGVAMGNGKDAVKAIADFVTAPVDQDGIYLAFERYGLL